MKKWNCILAVVSILGLASIGLSVENPGIRNPAGLSTMPPSSLGGGLVTSPNPIDRSGNLYGNLTITGNVRRGRHFRGLVPYNARTDFGEVLGSSSLDSFLRDSAGYEDFGRYSGKYSPQPFFPRSKTVPITVPGRPGVFDPIRARATRRTPDIFGLEVLDKRRIQQIRGADAANLAMRSTPLTPEEVRQLTSGLTRVTPQSEPASARLYRMQLEQIRQDLIRMRAKEPPAKPGEKKIEDIKGKAERDELLRLLTEPGITAAQRQEGLDRTRRLEAPIERAKRLEAEAMKLEQQSKAEQDVSPLEREEKEALDRLLPSYDREKLTPARQSARSMADLERLVEQIANLRRKGTGATTDETVQIGVRKTDAAAEKATEVAEVPGLIMPKSFKDIVLENDQAQKASTTLPTLPEIEKIKNLSDAEVSLRAKRIMRGHKSYESYSQARFKQYMAEAQAYLKQGKYYRAANAYDQAAVFDSKDPETMAGKSLALFAAGEYISSSLFLSRAIEISPKYARTKIDLGAAIGDRDKLETRIIDAEEWLERSCAPELEFLLAYMYYHNGRIELAKRAIGNAAEDMPNSKAVKALKEAIDAAPVSGKVK